MQIFEFILAVVEVFKCRYSPSTCGVVFFGKPNDIPVSDSWTINNHSYGGFSPNQCRNFILNFPQTSDSNWPCIYGRSVITGGVGADSCWTGKMCHNRFHYLITPCFYTPNTGLVQIHPPRACKVGFAVYTERVSGWMKGLAGLLGRYHLDRWTQYEWNNSRSDFCPI